MPTAPRGSDGRFLNLDGSGPSPPGAVFRWSVREAGARVIAGLGMSRLLECEELDWWQAARISDRVQVTFVPSQHWSRRGLGDTNRALWGGFVVAGPSGRVYHSGDTAYFEGFGEIGRRFPRIDAALLPIGAYDPPWFLEKQHMNPEHAVQAFLDLGARRLGAVHWGTFKLTDEPPHRPPPRLRARWGGRWCPVEAPPRPGP